MKRTSARKKIEKLLGEVDIIVHGDRPWDIKVHDDRFFQQVMAYGSIGAGEAYMDGWWDSDDLVEFFKRIIRGNIPDKIQWNIPTLWLILKSRLFNMQTIQRAKKVATSHYNLGNEVYMSFLDPYNQYTCGYFKDTTDLNQAQENKLGLICRKLDLRKSDKVLDIGCGWGGFAKYASERYHCHVTGISIADEQIKYARAFCKDLPVDIVKLDYRDLTGKFDKVLICGMIEHVGYRNYRTIMHKVAEVLADDGLFLLHTIGNNRSNKSTDPWMVKYIFSNSMTPSMPQLTKAYDGILVLEDWQNLGHHYGKTIVAMFENFNANWKSLEVSYGPKFYRMWKYYLLGSAGFFASRQGQLWQMVFSRHGVPGGYMAVR